MASQWMFLSEVLALVPELSRRSLMDLVRLGKAPQPYRVTPRPRDPRFKRCEIATWLQARGLELAL